MSLVCSISTFAFIVRSGRTGGGQEGEEAREGEVDEVSATMQLQKLQGRSACLLSVVP